MGDEGIRGQQTTFLFFFFGGVGDEGIRGDLKFYLNRLPRVVFPDSVHSPCVIFYHM